MGQTAKSNKQLLARSTIQFLSKFLDMKKGETTYWNGRGIGIQKVSRKSVYLYVAMDKISGLKNSDIFNGFSHMIDVARNSGVTVFLSTQERDDYLNVRLERIRRIKAAVPKVRKTNVTASRTVRKRVPSVRKKKALGKNQ